jgi:hypothetical protein
VDGNNGDQLIDQNVDLTPYAAPIGDSNGVQVNFVGYARSDGDDDWAFGLRMYDDQDDNVFSQNPNYSQATGWNEEQLGGVAPATARRARVMLWCERDSGTHCSAWYDDLSLTLTYPAP